MVEVPVHSGHYSPAFDGSVIIVIWDGLVGHQDGLWWLGGGELGWSWQVESVYRGAC